MNSFTGFAGSYAAARALAQALLATTRQLALTGAVATEAARAADLVQTVLAPRITGTDRVAEIGEVLVAALRAIGTDAAPRDAAPAFFAMASAAAQVVPVTASPGLTRQNALARALAACVEAAALGEAFLAEARTDHTDRRAAAAARARIARAVDAATDRIARNAGGTVYGIVSEVARVCSEHLVTVSNDLRPLVQVQTPRSMPATALAWALYGDPARAEELVARNRVGASLFMPTTIEAVSPSAGV